MPLLVRPFRPSDTPRLQTICRQTAIERPFLPFADDPHLAPAFYLDPYLRLEPESCFVAEFEGRVIAYLAGTRNASLFQRQLDRYLRRRLPQLLCQHFVGTVRGRYRHALSHRLLLGKYFRIIRGHPFEQGRIDLARYPAHCHLQVAPESRAQRAGLALMLKFHEYLKAQGVSGQHSVLVEEVGHEGYSRMLLAMRFRLIHEHSFTSVDRPSLIHSGTWRERMLVREF